MGENQYQRSTQKNPVQHSGECRRNQSQETLRKETEETGIGKNDTIHNRRQAESQILGRIAIEGVAGQPQYYLSPQIIKAQGQNQEEDKTNATNQDSLKRFALEQLLDQYQNQKSRSHGNIGLINAERKYQTAQAKKSRPFLALLHHGNRENCQEKGQRKRRTGEHIAKQTDEGREYHDAAGKQNL